MASHRLAGHDPRRLLLLAGRGSHGRRSVSQPRLIVDFVCERSLIRVTYLDSFETIFAGRYYCGAPQEFARDLYGNPRLPMLLQSPMRGTDSDSSYDSWTNVYSSCLLRQSAHSVSYWRYVHLPICTRLHWTGCCNSSPLHIFPPVLQHAVVACCIPHFALHIFYNILTMIISFTRTS
ncbi:hypothetical protein DFH29DRAFT_624180 [Suillus ampliporus]|nr:hypothetical protein DFH29DRAFT_624180 [Suillus ampliporus]